MHKNGHTLVLKKSSNHSVVVKWSTTCEDKKLLINSGTPLVLTNFTLFLHFLGNGFLITLAPSILEYILKYAVQPHHTSEEIVFLIEMLSMFYVDLRKKVSQGHQSQHPGAGCVTFWAAFGCAAGHRNGKRGCSAAREPWGDRLGAEVALRRTKQWHCSLFTEQTLMEQQKKSKAERYIKCSGNLATYYKYKWRMWTQLQNDPEQIGSW